MPEEDSEKGIDNTQPSPEAAEMREAIDGLAAKQAAEASPQPSFSVEQFETSMEEVRGEIRTAALEHGRMADDCFDRAQAALKLLDQFIGDAPSEIAQGLYDTSASARRELQRAEDDERTWIADTGNDRVEAEDMLVKGYGYSKERYDSTGDFSKRTKEAGEDIQGEFRKQVDALANIEQDFNQVVEIVKRMVGVINDQPTGASHDQLSQLQDSLSLKILPELSSIQLKLDDANRDYRAKLEQTAKKGLDIVGSTRN